MILIHITANFAWNFANLRLKIRFELSCGSNSCSKVRGILPQTANYFTKVRADQNNRCREKSTKNRELSKRFLFKRNIVEKPRKARISLKFVCITFSQYCITIPASYLMKLLILSEELFLSKRVMVAWSKHNTIVLSGGTINTAANLECWRWRCGLQVLEQKRIPSLQYFKFLKLFTIVLLEDLSGL